MDFLKVSRTETQALTELESLYLDLQDLMRHLDESRIEGLRFKHPSDYMTSYGYSLGSVAWYIRLFTNGMRITIFGATPEQVIINTIDFVQGLNSSTDKHLYIQDFLESHRQQSDEIARY